MTAINLNKLRDEVTPLLEAHGVELVAFEWFQGNGRGLLRITVDLPGGHPSVKDPEQSIGLEKVTAVTRDVSAALDTLDEQGHIPQLYTLEVGSPGNERPVQKREDFERFAGLRAHLESRDTSGKSTFNGTLRGVAEHAADGFAVKIECAGKVHEIPAGRLARAWLQEVKEAPKAKPGKGPSKRQQRLAGRKEAQAINEAHLRTKVEQTADAGGVVVGEGSDAKSVGSER